MKDTQYAYAVAYIHTLENKMLSRADFEALLSAATAQDAVRYLLDKGYGGSQSTNAEELLKSELAFTWNEVKNACPKGAPIDILQYQNDFHNIKAVLKACFSATSYAPLIMEPCTIPHDALYTAIAEGKPDSLPEVFRKPATEAYRLIAREENGQLAEIVLDKALFTVIKGMVNQTNSKFLSGWVDLCIGIMNMKIALRGAAQGNSKAFLRNAMLECSFINADHLAEAASRDMAAVIQLFAASGMEDAARAAAAPALFEKWCDNRIIEYIRAARYKAFGFEPILGFLIGKQYELQAVRIILSGIRGGISADALRERLRDSYV